MTEEESLEIRRLNDAINAINNTAKRCVRGEDGTLYILNQEGGTTKEELNFTGEMLHSFLKKEVYKRDVCLPGPLSDRFREDMHLDLFDLENPLFEKKNPKLTLVKAIVPGLKSLKHTIHLLLIENGIQNLSQEDLEQFFNKTCDDPRCLRGLYGSNIPPLCVQHPPWFYHPSNHPEYLQKVVTYITEFGKNQISFECALCAQYHEIVDSSSVSDDVSTTLTLASTPNEFALNKKIMSLYSLHTFEEANFFDFKGLCFKEHLPNEFIVEYNGEIYD